MISLLDYVEQINEGSTKTKINGNWVIPGQTVICSNPVYPDKADWELKFVEKEGKNIRGANKYGVVVSVPIDKIKEIIPMENQPKDKQELSPKQIQNIKYKIADLESDLMEIMRDMENDPDAMAEAEQGGGPVTDKYGKQMNKIQKQIDAYYKKLNPDS